MKYQLVMKNTGEIIYTPPQDFEIIESLFKNLESYINEKNEIDGLINMAIIHHQFESIHPFYDGNGRTGRIINVLYLILQDLLDLPILYLSSYIISNKDDYYRLLQEVRTEDKWEERILYILDAVEQTSKNTIKMIEEIQSLMETTQNEIKKELPKIPRKDLIEILFTYPYTKIDFLVDRLNITRQTASKYLNELEKIGILEAVKIRNSKFFINVKLFSMLKKGT